MKGTRPLNNNEIRLVSACFTGNPFEAHNRGLFMLGVSTGGRISELLSLTIGDVYQNRKAVTDLLYDRSIVKGGEISRAVPVEYRRHASHRRSGTLASGEVPKLESQPSAFSVSQWQGKAMHDAKGCPQCFERRFRGCRTQRTPLQRILCESRLPKGCTSRRVMFSPFKRC